MRCAAPCSTAVDRVSWFLSETITSPSLAAQWKQLQAKYPQAKLVQWEPVNRDSARIASKAALGDFYDAQYKLENADVILSLDADFLSSNAFPGFLPMSAAYAERHRYEARQGDEPAVCRREHADGHRRQGGTSPGAEAERDREVCERSRFRVGLRRLRSGAEVLYGAARRSEEGRLQGRGDCGRSELARRAGCCTTRSMRSLARLVPPSCTPKRSRRSRRFRTTISRHGRQR